MRRLWTVEQRTAICQTAYDWIGTPYKLRGMSRDGIDCSYLVMRVFESIGVRVTPKADYLFLVSDLVAPDQLQPGDLVFFCRSPRPRKKLATHVGIYVGEGNIIHAGRKGVAKTPLSEIKGLITSKNREVLLDWVDELLNTDP